MPLITLTGPPKIIDENGIEIQMPHHPIRDGRRTILVDETNWKQKSDRSIGTQNGLKFSRPRFEAEFVIPDISVAQQVIRALKGQTITYVPRTRAPGDNASEPELAFQCHVLDRVRNTKHVKQGVLRLKMVLEAVSPICNVAAVLASFRGQINASGIAFNLNDYMGVINLGEYPTCSDFWENVQPGGGNIRCRTATGLELPFELGPDFDYNNRVGHMWFGVDVSSISNTLVDVVAVDQIIPALPSPNAANGQFSVYRSNKQHWHLGQLAASETLEDSSIKGDDLVPTGMDDTNRVPSLLGFRQTFDGTEDAQASIALADFPANSFCIEAWVEMPSGASNGAAFGICGMNNDVANGPPLFNLDRSEFDTWRFAVANSSDTVFVIESASTVTDDEETHIFAVYHTFDNGLTYELRLYVNGLTANTPQIATVPRSAANGNFVIGGRWFNDIITGRWPGEIGGVTLYDGLPVSEDALELWIAKRYQQTKEPQTLFSSIVPITKRVQNRGFGSQPFSTMFPKNMPFAVAGAAYGIVTESNGDQVLIVAGGFRYDTNVTTSTVSRYNFRTNEWTTASAMPGPRVNAAHGVLNNQLYVAAGWNGAAETSSLYVRDTDTGLWSTLTPTGVPTARNGPGYAVLNNELWMIGGVAPGVVFSTQVHSYNPDTDAWTAQTSYPVGRFLPVAGAVGGRLHVVGGGVGTNRYNEHYEYVAGVWTARANLPNNVQSGEMVDLFGQPLVLMGGINSSNYTDEMHIWNALGDSWTTLAETWPAAIGNFFAVQIDNHTLIGGGFGDDPGFSDRGYDDVHVFTHVDESEPLFNRELRDVNYLPAGWSTSSGSSDFVPAPVPGDGRRAAACGTIGDYIVIVGGETASGSPKQKGTYIYDPFLNAWMQGADFPVSNGVTVPGFGVYNGELWIFGGANAGVSWYSAIYSYNLATNTWTFRGSMPNVTIGPGGSWYNGLFYAVRGSELKADVYDPVTENWTALPNPPVALFVPSSVEFRGKIYFLGEFPPADDFFRYDVDGGVWETLNNFPENTIGGQLFVYNDTLYYYQGDENNSSPRRARLWIYDVDLDSWSLVTGGTAIDPIQSAFGCVHNDRFHLFTGVDDSDVHTTLHQVYSFKQSHL